MQDEIQGYCIGTATILNLGLQLLTWKTNITNLKHAIGNMVKRSDTNEVMNIWNILAEVYTTTVQNVSYKQCR